ncbi:hypothetical protein M427DRAFT_70971 [Gonapodya prolifera JEL478]|uniref:Lytic polysaccharide monooxygenase n=1 Tax=Gonapodya prolifera (strain JEL478) TaxID=1344416 RepID=A0A139ABJ4_GONPJ|nr:hypothetical protein M427DRAFT_70971 [Gonapodya prolifera JEL478]|eukprot:KXS13845.1 hypothetical protein M427DRAFT_70971 [Gonapodya prolifera JEL478]
MVPSRLLLSGIAATLALNLLVAPATAFSNGGLIPSYICDLVDQAAGSPKSLGQIVPQLVEGDDAMQKVAGYHFHFMAPYAALDLCTINVVSGAAVTPTTVFQLATKNTSHIVVGMILWVQSNAAAQPVQVGTFTNPGVNMIPYPWRGCGKPNATIVHSQALDEDGNPTPNLSTLMTWSMGADKVTTPTVTVRGVCAVMGPDGTQGGYGPFSVELPVNAAAMGMKTTAAMNQAKTSAATMKQVKTKAQKTKKTKATKPAAAATQAAVATQAATAGATCVPVA